VRLSKVKFLMEPRIGGVTTIIDGQEIEGVVGVQIFAYADSLPVIELTFYADVEIEGPLLDCVRVAQEDSAETS
jgi:hypothetical protein